MELFIGILISLAFLSLVYFIILFLHKLDGIKITVFADSRYFDTINKKDKYSSWEIQKIGEESIMITDPEIGIIEIKKNKKEQEEVITVFQTTIKFFHLSSKKQTFKVFEILNEMKDSEPLESLDLEEKEIATLFDNENGEKENHAR